MNARVARLVSLLRPGDPKDMTRVLARGASGTLILKVAAVGLAFLTNAVAARVMGSAGYGAYMYALKWTNLLAIPVILGFDRLLVREVAAHAAHARWGLAAGVLKRANVLVLTVSGGVCVAAGMIVWLLRDSRPELMGPLLVALALLPLLALSRLRQSALQGLHRVVLAQMPEMIVRPVVFIGGLLAVHVFVRAAVPATSGVIVQFGATALSFAVGAYLLRANLPQGLKEARPEEVPLEWKATIVPMVLFSTLSAANSAADALFVGTLAGAEAAGLYSTAELGAGLIGFPLKAMNTALAPTAAALYAVANMNKLQQVVTKSTRVITIIALPVTVAMIAFGGYFLRLFGPDFASARMPLIILSCGEFVNAAMGSVGLLLLMTGHEDDATRTFVICLIVKIALHLVVTPTYGVLGASIISAGCMVLWNVLLAIYVHRRLGLRVSAFGGGRRG